MNDTLQLQLEERSKRIYTKLSSLLFWEWDEKLNIPLVEVAKKHADQVKELLTEEFEFSWSVESLASAPKAIQEISQALSGMRGNQMLFTTNPESGAILFASWWPWTNNEKVSVRIGLNYGGKMAMTEIELTLSMRKWFNLE